MSNVTKTRRHSRRRGFMFLDAVVGLMLLGVLATVMAVTLDRSRRVETRMAQARAATRAAERVLVAVEAGAKLPDVEEGTAVSVTKVEGEAGERVWVKVEGRVEGRAAVLYGLVPAAAAEEAARALPVKDTGVKQ